MAGNLALIDWIVVVVVILVIATVGLWFSRRGSKDLDAFFVSGRSLPWYIAGASMIATSFAADTPLWVTNLVRKFGVHYIWQFWAPFIGAVLAAVYFARLWRRMGFVTDVQFLETRYKGRLAGVLRAWSGGFGALLICPLIVSWVVKAMETISREAMGLPEEYRIYTTIIVVLVGMVLCTFSGLFGVVYTDFIQFFIATFGTVTLAFLAVREVGGLDALVTQLSQMTDWAGHELRILPSIGSGFGQMSIWNAIGLFGILWIGVGTSGGHQAQRLLASRNTLHASQAQILHAVVYYALMAWPWIIVALCSMVIFPVIDAQDQAVAYPRMLVALMPLGLRGLLIAALLAAFISTISTLFNWGSSYLVNDIYRRFINQHATQKSYVRIARISTVFIAITGATISFFAQDIQQLLTIAYVVGSGTAVLTVLRWLWWRLTVEGDFAGILCGWIIAPLLLFGRVFDVPAAWLLDLEAGVRFSSDPTLLGARMLFMVVTLTTIIVVVSLLTKPTDDETLKTFVARARPFRWCWLPIIRKMDQPYVEYEDFPRTMLSWIIGVFGVGSLLLGIGELLLGSNTKGVAGIAVAVLAITWTVRRMRADFEKQTELSRNDPLLNPVKE
jgi:solute:Na+ symporter, SSS family